MLHEFSGLCTLYARAGVPAGIAQTAKHSSPVPAADVCSSAAAFDAADCSPPAASQLKHRSAPEPGCRTAGEHDQGHSCLSDRYARVGARAVVECEIYSSLPFLNAGQYLSWSSRLLTKWHISPADRIHTGHSKGNFHQEPLQFDLCCPLNYNKTVEIVPLTWCNPSSAGCTEFVCNCG